mmetsp:Transcript_18741/g.34725  ORF Transcript_18741/g.34725 Transcript_18741/m.34725 type:complete len:1228 (+) Transcript_18741:202-3885(+)
MTDESSHDQARATLDELERLQPPLFVDLSTFWITNIRNAVATAVSSFDESHKSTVALCTRLIDTGKSFSSIWPDSELAKAISQKNAMRDTYMRKIRYGIRETSKRRATRAQELEDAVACLDKIYSALDPELRCYGPGLTCELKIESMNNEIISLKNWSLELVRLQSELESIEQDGMQEPDMKLFVELLQQRDAASEAFEEISKTSKKSSKEDIEKARVLLQRAESAFQRERSRISSISARYFPQLFVLHEELRISGEDIGDDDGLFVEGRHLNHFSVEKELSPDGCRHIVRLATFEGKQVVLKEYRVTGEPSSRRRVRREARLLRLLGEHPNIANIDAVFVHPPEHGMQLAYLQMPFYEGGSLTEWLEEKKPPTNVKQSIFSQFAQALQHVHANGVVHADIKLDNVLVDSEGVPLLCDFEMSRAKGMTSTSAAVGTADYIAPEVREAQPGEKIQPAADMFSFGVCLLFAFCNSSQYERDADNTLKKFTSPDVDENLVEIITDLLQRDPQKRPSAVEVARYAFLDPMTAYEKANERAEAAKKEEQRVERKAKEEAARLEREAKDNARKLRQQEADARRRIAEKEAASQDRIKEAREAVNKKKREVQEKAAQVKKEEESIQKREKDVNSDKAKVKSDREALKKKKTEIAAENKAMEKEQERIEKERRELAKIRSTKSVVPGYWASKNTATNTFKMVPIHFSPAKSSCWQVLERAMNTSNLHENRGRQPYDEIPTTYFRVAQAWRNENVAAWKAYNGMREKIISECNLLRKFKKNLTLVGRHDISLKRETDDLPGALESSVNEVYLVRCTSNDTLAKILTVGTNQRFCGVGSGSWFGLGSYFGESAKTSNFYADGNLDLKKGQFPELHKMLYSNEADHPNGVDKDPRAVHYMMLCRVIMGKFAKYRGEMTSQSSLNSDDGRPLYHKYARPREELNTISGVKPELHYHSLMAQKPPGTMGINAQNEIIMFHDEYVYPEYVIAYHRSSKKSNSLEFRRSQLESRRPPAAPNMRVREDVQILIAHVAIWEANCGVAGGFVRDYIINNDPCNDVDTLLLNGRDAYQVHAMLQNMASRHGGIRVSDVTGKGNTKKCVISSSSNCWVPIDVDLSDPTKMDGLSPAPGIDCNAGNLMFTQRGIVLKINVAGLPDVKTTIEHIKHKRFVYLQNFNDSKIYGSESGQSKCERRLMKYLERGWTCLTPVPNSIMSKDKFKKFKPLVKPEAKFTKDWWKLK